MWNVAHRKCINKYKNENECKVHVYILKMSVLLCKHWVACFNCFCHNASFWTVNTVYYSEVTDTLEHAYLVIPGQSATAAHRSEQVSDLVASRRWPLCFWTSPSPGNAEVCLIHKLGQCLNLTWLTWCFLAYLQIFSLKESSGRLVALKIQDYALQVSRSLNFLIFEVCWSPSFDFL